MHGKNVLRGVFWPAGVVSLSLWSMLAGCAVTAPHSGIDSFAKIRWPGGARLAPDQTLYYVYDPDGIDQLYAVPADRTMEHAVRLTDFEDGIDGYRLSKDGRLIAITASKGGSEQSDLYLMRTSDGTLEPLFEDPEIVYGGVVWRRDSKAFAYRANDESPADFHVYVYDVESKKHTKVISETGYHFAADFNRDGTKLVVGKYHSASYTQLFEVTLASGEVREITPKDEQWSFGPIGYDTAGRNFFVNTDYHGDLKQIHTIDLRTGEIKPRLAELRGHHVDFGTLNMDRSVLAVGTNEDGYRKLHLFRTTDLTPVRGPEMGVGIVGNVSFQGRFLLHSLSNANTPGIIYRSDLNDPDKPAVALTEANTQGIDVSRFTLPKLVHYDSFDGEKIPAFLYLPSDYRAGKRIRFIVYYHGGPESQFRPGFMRTFQYFLSRGYGVMAPNVRGSSGYGKAYIEADNYKNRFKSVNDGVWAAKYLIDNGYSKEKMIGAWGGSYGGFMVMAVITEAPKVFGAACNVVGIANFKTFLEQTKAYRRKLREAEYGPLSDPEFLESISPIRNVDKIETPLLIAHGLNDPRVPIGEAMQIAVALKKRGMHVSELYFPDEGHGFAKEGNRLLYYAELARFMDEHLR